MLHRRPGVCTPLTGRYALAGRIQLRNQGAEVAQALRSGSVFQRLVLRKHVDEPLADVVAVPAEQVTALFAEDRQNIPHLALRAESVRH